MEEEAQAKGQSVVYLAQEEQVATTFALADVIRPESKKVVDRLHEMGIEVTMLTGDSEVAAAVADELGIDHYFAEVLPEHKEQKVRQLQGEGKRLAPRAKKSPGRVTGAWVRFSASSGTTHDVRCLAVYGL